MLKAKKKRKLFLKENIFLRIHFEIWSNIALKYILSLSATPAFLIRNKNSFKGKFLLLFWVEMKKKMCLPFKSIGAQ